MSNQKRDSILNKEIPQEIQNNNENKATSDIAETIATILIDKMISTAVITTKVNQTYKTLNDHCFNYLTNFINPYLESGFIFYENGIEDCDYQKKQIYFCHKPLEKLNTWELIPEPDTCEMDRYANNKTKVVKFNKYTDIKMDNVKESSVAFDVSEDTKIMKNNENVYDESTKLPKNKKREKEEEKSYNNKNEKPKKRNQRKCCRPKRKSKN